MIWPLASAISFRTAFSRSSNSPRYLEPATIALRSSATTRRSLSPSGTSPETIRCASPSTIAVLPTPGSPIRTGLFFVRRESTWMTRRISSSRPITGSSLPCGGGLGQVAAVALERLELLLGVLVGHAVAAAHLGERLEQLLVGGADAAQRLAGLAGMVGEREQQVLGRDVLVLQLAHLRLGVAQDLDELGRAAGRLGARGALELRQRVERLRRCVWRTAAGSTPSLRSTGTTMPAVLLEQDREQVLGHRLRVAALVGQPLRGLQRLLGLDRKTVWLHGVFQGLRVGKI